MHIHVSRLSHTFFNDDVPLGEWVYFSAILCILDFFTFIVDLKIYVGILKNIFLFASYFLFIYKCLKFHLKNIKKQKTIPVNEREKRIEKVWILILLTFVPLFQNRNCLTRFSRSSGSQVVIASLDSIVGVQWSE